ncbi:MAG: hypothetical protein QOI44_255, partial [Actinomycetota bacterium]|nr:hypothetical protein [Actinomycetota bacterium]
AIQPGNEQCAAVGQRVVDNGGAQSFRAAAHCQPGAARVLGLDREEPLDDRLGATASSSGEQLGPKPGRDDVSR